MEGNSESQATEGNTNPEGANGVTFQAIKELFDQVAATKREGKKHLRVYCSFLQIYNEKIYDLLNVNSLEEGGLRLRWNKEDQFKVENLYVFEVESDTEAKDVYSYGIKNRIMAAHNLNLHSSRSHCILTLTVESMDKETMEQVVISKLQLIDLAGSERTALTGNTADERHMKESIDINKSLFNLRKVISLLAEASNSTAANRENAFIPYRDSKLTSLLKQSLGGNSYCLMVSAMFELISLDRLHRPSGCLYRRVSQHHRICCHGLLHRQ
jgi:hypothetical protein